MLLDSFLYPSLNIATIRVNFLHHSKQVQVNSDHSARKSGSVSKQPNYFLSINSNFDDSHA